MGRHYDIHGVTYSTTVTTSDSAILPITRAIYVGVAGTVKVTYGTGITDTLTNLAAGVWHPMQVSVIWATGTTATDIHAGY